MWRRGVAGLSVLWVGLLAVLLAVKPVSVLGQFGGRSGGRSGGGDEDLQVIEAPLLDVSHAMRAHRQVRDWLTQSEVSMDGLAPIRVTGLFGVRITLRVQGFTVGEGWAYRADVDAVVDALGPGVDLLEILGRATEQAIEGIRQSLLDARLRSLLEGRSLPEPGELSVTEVSHRVLVDLELGYDLQTLRVAEDAPPGQVYARFAPSFHGLGFVGSQPGSLAYIWPGEAIARNISPTSQLVLGLKRLGYDRSRLGRIARRDGVGLLRFQTIHVVQPVIDMHPMQLVRGNADLPRYTVSDRVLAGIGDRLAEHLNGRLTTDREVRGTYHPTSGRFAPSIAPGDQAALVCYALTHYSRYLRQVRPKDTRVSIFSERALEAATRLGRASLKAGDRSKPQVQALVLLTLLETSTADADRALRDGLGERLLSHVQAQATSRQSDEADQPQRISDAASALVVAALATLYEQTRDDRMGEAVRTELDRLWGADDGVSVSALPWVALAHERAGGLLLDVDASGARLAEMNRRAGIKAWVIDRLCEHQVIERPQRGPDDVLGGIVLTPGLTGSPPNPDWHNAQPLMFISVALRDEAVTQDHDKLGWLLSAGYAARFIGQLMMDQTNSYYVRDPLAAVGGVRMALWDNRLAPAPTAISLLAVTELQQTLRYFNPPPAPIQDSADMPQDGSAGETDMDVEVEVQTQTGAEPAKPTGP